MSGAQFSFLTCYVEPLLHMMDGQLMPELISEEDMGELLGLFVSIQKLCDKIIDHHNAYKSKDAVAVDHNVAVPSGTLSFIGE